MNDSKSLKPGMTLYGKYTIKSVLGHGSFGITYLATTEITTQGNLGAMKFEAKVAIKEFFMSDLNTRRGSSVEGSGSNVFTNYRHKFRKEAENLAKLSHGNIVKVYDIFDENNTTYYVMDFVEGDSLDKYIEKKGRLPETESIMVIKEVGRPLDFMHSRNMLHLDLKPGNIMRSASGDYKLIDFGLSKQFTKNGEPESSTTLGLGTPGYAPVEQSSYKREEGKFPATLDIYALGATMFKMLTGKRPPEATYILNEEFPRESLSAAGVSAQTIAAVEKAMWPLKKGRYQSVRDFLEALPRVDDEVIPVGVEEATIYSRHEPTSPKSDENTPFTSEELLRRGQIAYYNKNYTEALKYYRKAAEQGNADAQQNLGYMYREGYGVTPDYSEAVKWYRKAADQGNAGAQYGLGYMFEFGFGVPKDYAEAVKWYRKAAVQEYALGQYGLGYMYKQGYGVPKDYTQAVKWYRKAAEQRVAPAQYTLGYMYCNGYGVTQDYSEAVKWYRKAADQEDIHAQYALGEMYEKGLGVTKDYKEAEKWYKASAGNGHEGGEIALQRLRNIKHVAQMNDKGCEAYKRHDYAEALKWWRKAAEQGLAEAQYWLGYTYEKGYGVIQDYAEAVKWYRKAADQEYAWAQSNLGYMYEHGYGVTQDYSEAVKWYRKAADQGSAEAQNNLGVMYEHCKGVTQNCFEAVSLYSKAAQQGLAPAQSNLGLCYEDGIGVEKNRAEAMKWYRKAADQGNSDAAEAIRCMENYKKWWKIF